MVIVYVIVALLISYLCLAFFEINTRFNKKQLTPILIAFGLGAIGRLSSIYIDIHITELFIPLELDSFVKTMLKIFSLSIFHLSIVFISFVLFHRFFSKFFEKPMDYLIYITCCALGFSAVENVTHINEYGSPIIGILVLYSFMVYLLSIAPIAYGFIKDHYHEKEHKTYHRFAFAFVSLLSVSIFRIVGMCFLENDEPYLNFIFCSFFFLIHLAFFVTTVKNAHNISALFTYKRSIDTGIIKKKILLIFVFILIIQSVLIFNQYGVGDTLYYLITSIISFGYMIYLSVDILARARFVKNRWNSLRIEFPFSTPPMGVFDDDTESEGELVFKGETYDEVHLSACYQEHFTLHLYPYTDEKYLVYIEEKFFFEDEKSFFLTRLYESDKNSSYRYVILIPKKGSESNAFEKYKLLALLNVDDPSSIENFTKTQESFEFENWGFIIDLDDEFSIYPD